MKISKRIGVLSLAVLMICSLTACREDPNANPLLKESKEYLVNEIDTLNEQVFDLAKENERLSDLLTGIQEEKGPTPGIKEMEDGTGRKTFTTVDGKISFPSEFMVPNTQQAPNSSAVNISDTVKIKPTNNWVAKLDGTRLIINHSSGITGEISIGTLDREHRNITIDEIETYLDEFISEFQVNAKSQKLIHYNKYPKGIDTSISTFIDSEEATMRLGMLANGDISLQYVFYYTTPKDDTYEEVITNLLKTISISNSPISIS